MVYVGFRVECIPNKVWRWDYVIHLFGDTDKELIEFAESLGLLRSWFQPSPPARVSHFDIVDSKAKLAIQNGAQQMTLDEEVEFIRNHTKKMVKK